MIHAKPSRVHARPARTRAAAWTLARALLLALTMAHRWLPHMTRGKTRAGLLRFISMQTGMLEQIFRCLLILMRAKPATPKPSPFVPRASAAPDTTSAPRRRRAPALLSLSQLSKGFEEGGALLALLEARKKPRRPDYPDRPKDPRGPTAAAPVADPFYLLDARLKAMRALLNDPHAHAAKLAALLKAAGIGLRAPKPLVPSAELWALLNCAPQTGVFARPGLIADTS